MLKMTMVSLLLPMFWTTFAPAGTGKVPTSPPTSSMRPAAAEDEAEAEAEGEAAAVLRLVAAGLVAAALDVEIPAEHAASDRPAAQAARAIPAGRAAERYVVMGFLNRHLSHMRCPAQAALRQT